MQMIKFVKGQRHYNGIQFLDGEEFKNDVMREFAGVIQEDPVIHEQIVGDSFFHNLIMTLDLRTNKIDSWKEFKKKMEVAIIQEGTSHSYFQTLYVFHNDWLLCCEEDNRLLVVDEKKINDFFKRSIDLKA